MEITKESLKKDIVKRVLVFLVLILILYLLRDLFNLFLLTFLFSYLIYSMQRFLVKKLPVNKTIITIFLYVIIAGLIGFFIYRYVPEIIREIRVIFREIFLQINRLSIPKEWSKYIGSTIEQFDISKYSDKGMSAIVVAGAIIVKGSTNIFISLMLSMFFVLEKEKIQKLVCKFKTSKISGIYGYFEYFGKNFLNSFGKVIQAQILIALINSILSVIALWIMHFPQLIGLGFMIFVLSLIPVAGTLISLVPLSLIAYSVGGPIKILSVIIMIALLHALESYVLNPKLMSDKTELPVFFTFMILIVGEHFMGVWGLLLGIPLFMFLLDILNVKVSDGEEKKDIDCNEIKDADN